jgi:hypothetical protein
MRIAIHTAKATTHVDPQGSIDGPPAIARITFCMRKGFAESTVLIGLMLLSIT